MPRRKTVLPMLLTRAYFRQHAKPLAIALDQVGTEAAKPWEYLTGSLGWQWTRKARIKVGECYGWAQINLTVTLIGSKDLPRENAAPAPNAAPPTRDPQGEVRASTPSRGC